MKIACLLIGLVSITYNYSITNLQKISTELVSVKYPTDCMKEKCPNELDACMKDPKCVPAIHDCEDKCKTSVSCWQFCLAGKGDAAAINLTKCGAEHNCF